MTEDEVEDEAEDRALPWLTIERRVFFEVSGFDFEAAFDDIFCFLRERGNRRNQIIIIKSKRKKKHLKKKANLIIGLG
jgi:hypothetical protein